MTTEIKGVCGECVFWIRGDIGGPRLLGAADIGLCFGVPPVPRAVLDKHGRLTGQGNMRPMLPATERCCSLFTVAAPLPGGANEPITGP
jgi:hypothetical protein